MIQCPERMRSEGSCCPENVCRACGYHEVEASILHSKDNQDSSYMINEKEGCAALLSTDVTKALEHYFVMA